MRTLLERSGEMKRGDEDAAEMDRIDAYEAVGVSKRTECEPIAADVLLLGVMDVEIC